MSRVVVALPEAGAGVCPPLLDTSTLDNKVRDGIAAVRLDVHTSAADVRVLEQQAKAAGKTNLEFSYYAGLDHGLGTMEYFTGPCAIWHTRGNWHAF